MRKSYQDIEKPNHPTQIRGYSTIRKQNLLDICKENEAIYKRIRSQTSDYSRRTLVKSMRDQEKNLAIVSKFYNGHILLPKNPRIPIKEKAEPKEMGPGEELANLPQNKAERPLSAPYKKVYKTIMNFNSMYIQDNERKGKERTESLLYKGAVEVNQNPGIIYISKFEKFIFYNEVSSSFPLKWLIKITI